MEPDSPCQMMLFALLFLNALSEPHPILFTLKHIRLLLTDEQRRRSNLILAISTLISLADVLGLSAMVPVLMLAIDKSFLKKAASSGGSMNCSISIRKHIF